MRRGWLAAEFLLLFGGAPMLILMVREPGILALVLWGGAGIVWLAGQGFGGAVPDPGWRRTVLLRFVTLAPLLTVAVLLLDSAHFLDLPRNHPLLWVLIMVAYPLLSVVPQELIYRRFLFHRYAVLLPDIRTRVAASAAAFGFAHIIFLNVWAVLLAGCGGILFAGTYARTRSLGACSIEHALYGALVFTIGLGRFFYTGAAWHS